jgi:hypothetical protein|eukprot:COSAG01_NODE_2984_length_6753_cov_235.182447_8_plen_309_part_00
MQAIFTQRDPRTLLGDDGAASTAAAAFADCPAYQLHKPALWPGPDSFTTSAQLLWDVGHLYILYAAEEGSFAPAIAIEQCDQPVLDTLLNDYRDPNQVSDTDFPDNDFQRVILLDDRCEVFVQPVVPGVPYQRYFSLEINRAGRAITNINNSVTSRRFYRGWEASDAFTAQFSEADCTLLVALRWSSLAIRPGATRVNIGLFRAQKPSDLAQHTEPGQAVDMALMHEINERMIWTAWRDPGDTQVDFHRSAFLGRLELCGGLDSEPEKKTPTTAAAALPPDSIATPRPVATALIRLLGWLRGGYRAKL